MSAERRPALEASYRALGATWTEARGCLLPEHFGDVRAEYYAVRKAAGVLDRTDCAYLTAAGPDAVRFLQGMLSNDVKRLQPGHGCYATQLTALGQMVADLYVFRMDDHLLLETDWSRRGPLREMLEKHIIADDVELSDRSEQLAALAVEGPHSGGLVAAAGAAALPGEEFDHTWVKLGETPVLVARLGETGEESYRLIFAVEYAQNVWDALSAQQAGVPWKPVGHAAFNILRTEAGLPRFGAEMDERTLPPEAGLERALSYTKGCYIGQETIERIRSRGHVNRQLIGLRLRGDSLPAAGAKLLLDAKEVGWITTAVESPTLGRIALAYVRREHREPGTKLTVESGGGAEVVALPFHYATR
ncbi:MAG: aminomethyltransferase family protein [Burkholderiales bacterium]